MSVLVGAPGAAEWIWQQWHESDAAHITITRGVEVLERWLGEEAVLNRLGEAVRREVARLEGIPLSELKSLLGGRSRWQLEELAAKRAAELDADESWLRHGLGISASNARLDVPRPGAIAKLHTLIGALPPLLVRTATTEFAAEIAQRLFEISEELPSVDLGLALDDSAFSSLRSSIPPRLLSTLTEGFIALRPQPRNGHNHGGGSIEYDDDSFARSRAERTLYEVLQSRARTRGLFALNHRLSGEPPLEVDLLCERLKLAVEIDGYHHFRDAEGYRRDRRKDVRLQELGYLVMRVLATDIDDELEHVIETIERAVFERPRRMG